MEKKKRMIRQGGFLILLSIFFILFAVGASALDTPWIEVPDDSGTKATTETETPTGTPATQETAAVTEPSTVGSPTVEIPASENETREEPAAENPTGEIKSGKKKGCGSTLSLSGIPLFLATVGTMRTIFPKRKENFHGTAN